MTGKNNINRFSRQTFSMKEWLWDVYRQASDISETHTGIGFLWSHFSLSGSYPGDHWLCQRGGMIMNSLKTRDFVGVCPACHANYHFQTLPRIGKALRCPVCRRWLKVSGRLPIQFDLHRPNKGWVHSSVRTLVASFVLWSRRKISLYTKMRSIDPAMRIAIFLRARTGL